MTDRAFHRIAVISISRNDDDIQETAPSFGRDYMCAAT